MMRSNLALSVADAGMSRLETFTEYKADWRGRRIEKIDPWFRPLKPAPNADASIPA
jgi:transposase